MKSNYKLFEVESKIIAALVLILFSFSTNGQCWKSVGGAGTFSVGIKQDGSLWKITYTSPPTLGSTLNWKSVSIGLGAEFHLALKDDNTLWRLNEYMNVQQVMLGNFKDIATWTDHNLAIKTDGSLWAWGENYHGQLGINNSQNTVYTPIQVGIATNWESVYAGRFTFAIKNDGSLWTWGRNTNELLDDNIVPTQIGTDTDWLTVSIGSVSTLLLKNDGTLWKIDGTTLPVQVGLENNWKAIVNAERAGYPSETIRAYYGLKTDGTLWAWGYYGFGPILGSNIVSFYENPVQIELSHRFESIWNRLDNLFAIKNDGSLWTRTESVNELTDLGCPLLTVQEFNSQFQQPLLFPNPCKTVLNIKTDNAIIEKIIITDISGKKVIEENEVYSKLNVEKLENGIYILETTLNGQTYIDKFIKE